VAKINGQCKNCQRYLNNEPGSKCNICGIILDMQCSDKIFNGNKKEQCHPHPLVLQLRRAWKCDICKNVFRGKCSFYCRQCDFDACDKCYIQN
jgi:hypothetical protein